MKNSFKLFFIAIFLPISCGGRNYHSDKIEYKKRQEISSSLEEVVNNIKFHTNGYSFVFKEDKLRQKLPAEKVIYGGENLELGYVIDSISEDYGVRFSVVDDVIIITSR